MLDKETKAYYEKIFLYFFDHISCPEKQKKAWVHGDYNACNTFGEVFEEFMSSCENVKTWPDFSAEQKEKLCKVYDLLENYDDMKEVEGKKVEKTDKEIHEDPAWQEIRTFARQVYEEIIKIPI